MIQSYVKMAENGRLVLPVSLRNEVGLTGGGDFLARVENGAIILEPHKKALERIRCLVRHYAPAEAGLSVAEELIAERHAEAARE